MRIDSLVIYLHSCFLPEWLIDSLWLLSLGGFVASAQIGCDLLCRLSLVSFVTHRLVFGLSLRRSVCIIIINLHSFPD